MKKGITIANSTAGTQYKWTIGKGVYYKRSFTLYFCSRTSGEDNIPIKLEVTSYPDKNCFPNDSGKDSYVKAIYLGRFRRNTALKGTYEGSWDDGSEPLTVKINPAKNTGLLRLWGIGDTTLAVYNFDGKERWYFGSYHDLSYRQGFFCCFYEDSLLLPTYPIFHDRIWVRVSDDNRTLTMKYTEVIRKTNQKINRTFTGKRISWNYEN